MTDWEERFRSHYKVGADDECWPWLSSKNLYGYGRFLLRGKSRIASRVAYEVAFGAPGAAHVLHKCDNPPCVNPRHLFLGTHQENVADMIRKGRRRSAPPKPTTILSAEQAAEIRRIAKSGVVTQRVIAARFGISQQHVSSIKHGHRR